MGILDNCEPKEVLKFFEEIASIPHGSENIWQISDYLVNFARERKLAYRQDESGNVIVKRPASKGYEEAAAVIIQGHMDMVAVKTDDCDKDMEKEGLDLELSGDYISARGTSLGGDDGIAIAYALAILDSDTIEHPPIEAVFTVNEEIGMLGATALDMSDLAGKILLNIDSEDEGIFTVSCAGGMVAESVFSGTREERTGESLINVSLKGFIGGHSGEEIDKGRANALMIMGRLLYGLKDLPYGLVNIEGGEKDNAIAKFAKVSLAIDADLSEELMKIIEKRWNEVLSEYALIEPNLNIKIEKMESDAVIFAFDSEFSKRIAGVIIDMPNGVSRMDPELAGKVLVSSNFGIAKTADDKVIFTNSIRSPRLSEKMAVYEKFENLVKVNGGSIRSYGEYPGWEYKPDSKIRDVMVEAYREIYGKEPVVEGIHAGLECGIFADKMPGLDCISFGPNIDDIHTTDERLSISSVERTWKLLLETLRRLR